MVDLREKVEEDRGLIKKIELAIPGFRGYRLREDARIADSLLRKQLADKLGDVRVILEDARSQLAKAMALDVIDDVGDLINLIRTVEERVRHAEQGYTGISADYRLNEDELHALYEYDLHLIDGVNTLRDLATRVRNGATHGGDELKKAIMDMRNGIRDFENVFSKRIEKIAGLGVFE